MNGVYAECEAVKARHVERLMALPGVTSVMVHFKRTGGQASERLSIRVSVLQKRPPSSLSSEEVIPAAIEGVPTDVYQAPYATYSAGNADPVRRRPLTGGIQILSLRPNTQLMVESGAGTLGGFVRERQPPHRVCALTNYHIVCPGILTQDTGYEVYQPVLGDTTCGLCRDSSIGRVHKTKIGLPWDAAIVALDPDAESPALTYNPGVLLIGATGNARALSELDIDPATRYPVKKSGIKTDLTNGFIVSGRFSGQVIDDGRLRDHQGVIQIRSSDSNMTFDLQGDSGALVLNVDNEPVALLFARRTITDPKEGPVGAIDGLACYLEDPPDGAFQGVLNAMDINFISGGGPTAPPITVPSGNLEGVDHRDSGGNIVTRGRRARGIVDWADARLRASAAGATLANTLWERRHEIVMLIKRSRSFRKDWHRCSGPTLMQELRTCLEQPDRPLPNNIRRGDTNECVHQILISLRTHASADLIRDIDQHGTRIGSLAGKTFSGFLQELADGP